MKVLDFIRSNANWEEALAAAPYYIKASHEGNYVLLKYNQLASDFNEEIVRECRGCIMHIPQGHHEWADVVCYPFDKFGNYGESYVPKLDWNSAVVKEKVDGSLIKVWWYNNEWHVSTNGTIDARKAPTSVEGKSFYDIFMCALLRYGNPAIFFDALDIDYTYMFELVSPETRVTIEYSKPALYYLGARNMLHLNEVSNPLPPGGSDLRHFLNFPKVYQLTTIEDCIKAVNEMTKDEEGFVVCDAQFNRVKIKSPEYLIAARVRNNGVITTRRVVEMMRAEQLDDFCAYAPQYQELVDNVIAAYNQYVADLNAVAAGALAHTEQQVSQKEFANWVFATLPRKDFQGFAFAYFNHKIPTSKEYLDRMTEAKLSDILKEYYLL